MQVDNSQNCPIIKANTILGDKWNLLIFKNLLSGNKRFCQLQSLIPEISSRTLTIKLKNLAGEKLINRKQFPEIPARVEYSLTEKGIHLKKVITEIEKFGQKYL